MYADVVLEVAQARLRAAARPRPRSARARASTTRELTAEDLGAARRALQGARSRRRPGKPLPAGPARAAVGRDRRRLPQLGQRPRAALPAAVRDPRRPGHRRQRAVHGLRQPRRRLRDRASRSRATRRRARTSSTASTCPTPRARTSSRASARRGRSRSAQAGGGGHDSLEAAMPRRYAQLLEIRDTLESALQGHAGHRVHDRARHAVHAPDAHREAHRPRRAAHRLRLQGSGRRSTRRRCCSASRPTCSSSCWPRSSTPRTRSSARTRDACSAEGPARGPRRRLGRHRLHRRARGRDGREGEEGAPRAHRDEPRGPRRDGRGGRHPDQPRRHDLARGGRRARHGQALRRRRRGAAASTRRRGG